LSALIVSLASVSASLAEKEVSVPDNPETSSSLLREESLLLSSVAYSDFIIADRPLLDESMPETMAAIPPVARLNGSFHSLG